VRRARRLCADDAEGYNVCIGVAHPERLGRSTVQSDDEDRSELSDDSRIAIGDGDAPRTRSAARGLGVVKDLSTILGTWVSISAAVFGGALALQTWREDAAKRVDQRVAYAFQFVEEFHRPDFVALRSSLLTEREAAGARLRCAEPSQNLSPNQLFSFVEFFDRAEMCVEAGLCDKGTLVSLLGPYANASSDDLLYHVAVQRKQNRRYGNGLLWLAAAYQRADKGFLGRLIDGGSPTDERSVERLLSSRVEACAEQYGPPHPLPRAPPG
jgi:hypothetical protein